MSEVVEENQRRYPIKYKATIGDYSKDELIAGNYGFCDAMILVAIFREKQANLRKSKTFNLYTIDGDSKSVIPDTEVFEAFVHLAGTLDNSVELEPWKMAIVNSVVKQVRAVFGSMISNEEEGEEKES